MTRSQVDNGKQLCEIRTSPQLSWQAKEFPMRAIKAARRLIEADPANPSAKVLAGLVRCLANDTPFKLVDLYALPPEHFAFAIEILNDWRLDRFYMGKAKLFDLSWQLDQMNP